MEAAGYPPERKEVPPIPASSRLATTNGFLHAVRAGEARIQPGCLLAFAFLALLALHARSLWDPPYWDALIGAFPQGLWLARNDFDLVRLVTAELNCGEGGPNVYPFSIYPLGIAALYALDLPPGVVFLVLHVFVLACAATAATAFFVLARERLPSPLGSLATLLFVGTPLFQSLASQMNMDMPLCALTLVSLLGLVRRRYGLAFLAAILALLLIPRGVILVAANASFIVLAVMRPGWAGFAGVNAVGIRPRVAFAWILAHVGLLAVFGVELLVLSAHATMPVHVGLLEGFAPLFSRTLWKIPEFGVGFLVALACGLAFAIRAVRGSGRPVDLACATFLVVLLVFYGQYKNPLPRYFLQAYPHTLLLVLAAISAATPWRWLTPSVVSLAIAINVVNIEGALYHDIGSGWTIPPTRNRSPLTVSGHLLERSMAYRRGQALSHDIASRLEEFDRDRTVIVANWPLAQALSIPEFGYVDRPWRVSSRPPLSYDPNAVPFEDLYDRSNGTMRKKTGDEILWAILPNAYFRPFLAPRAGLDEMVAVFEQGKCEAFVFRRQDPERAGDR
jgi:hypothetical protein